MVFEASRDRNTKNKIFFRKPVRARYVRIFPVAFKSWPSMRGAVLLCERPCVNKMLDYKFDYSFLVFVFFLQHVHRSRYHSCSYFGSCIPLKSVCGAGASAFARPEPPADRARRLRHARQHVAAARAGTFFAFCQVYQLQMLSHSVHVVSFSALVTFSFLSSDIRPGIRWQ